MADHPLRPANHRRLGRPLPYQLANGTQTPPRTVAYIRGHLSSSYLAIKRTYPVLAHLSVGYPRCQGRLLTRYSPVRHSTSLPKKTFAFDLHVLSTPPAFVLSQDQTLQFDILNCISTVSYLLSRAILLNYKDCPMVIYHHQGPFAVLLFSFQGSFIAN